MSRRFSQLQFDNSLAGLGNYLSTTFNFAVTSHSLPVGNASSWSSTWPLNNTNAISGVQINYAGLETVWRPVSGSMAINVPYVTPQYQILAITYYAGGNFQISIYISNQTGGTITVPAFSVNVRLFLFNAPF
jgi:hypothetical protein